MQVSTTHFNAGTDVGLYEGFTRPSATSKPDKHKKVPKDGLVSFPVEGAVGSVCFIAGGDPFMAVQVFVKDGDPIHPSDRLEATRPQESAVTLTEGARSTMSSKQEKDLEKLQDAAGPAVEPDLAINAESVARSMGNAAGNEPDLHPSDEVPDPKEMAEKSGIELGDVANEDGKPVEAKPAARKRKS